ncbi:MAG: glycoside hydrolase family 43 protein [Acidimicrobiales bacterium]
MTTVDALVTSRHLSRPRVLVLVGSVLAVALAGLFIFRYQQARARLDDEHARLAAAAESLADTRAEHDRTRRRTALTRDGVALVRSEVELAVAARTWIEAVTRNTQQQITGVEADRTETDTARFLIAAHANEVRSCLAGVSRAVGASRAGEVRSSVAALRGTAGECTRTLAYASGARFPYDFADPFVLSAEGTYYGYSTNAGAGDIQVIRSPDLVNWELVGNGLADMPRWAAPNATWAPAVLARGGGYVAYYTVRDAASLRQCISRAVSDTPAGPFVDGSSGPLVCQFADGGSIDPSPFVDGDGRAYLLWKSEGRGAAPATIWSQELSPDGMALVAAAGALLVADRAFERGVIEAPSLVHEAGGYYLLYAAADWSSRSYSVAYARCAGPVGPCLKPGDGRVLVSGPRLAGPGGAEVFRDAGGSPWTAFHAFAEPDVGYPSSRYLHLARLRVVDGRIVLDAST